MLHGLLHMKFIGSCGTCQREARETGQSTSSPLRQNFGLPGLKGIGWYWLCLLKGGAGRLGHSEGVRKTSCTTGRMTAGFCSHDNASAASSCCCFKQPLAVCSTMGAAAANIISVLSGHECMRDSQVTGFAE